MTLQNQIQLGAASVRDLRARHGHLRGKELIRAVIKGELAGRTALVSSFGAESAVLLHMAAQVDPGLPILFIDTGKLFEETLAYRDALTSRLGLHNVRTLTPSPSLAAQLDPDGTLWSSDPDLCCHLRKVEPLEQALSGYAAWISGRKRYQSTLRQRLETIEADGDRIKINPLADFSAAEIETYRRQHDLPAHPLVARGYPSIGCAPCTTPVRPGEAIRAGRWRGREKTECGIHFSGGRVVRAEAVRPTINENS